MANIMSRALASQRKRSCYKLYSLASDLVNSTVRQTVNCSTNSNPSLTYTTTSLTKVVSQVQDKLAAAGVPEPELSANYLLSRSLLSSSDKTTPVLAHDWSREEATSLNQEQADLLDRLVQCRLSRMPVQYILGNWDFHNITIKVRPPVFIPRPETEELVDLVLSSLPPPSGEHIHLLEIGPGTGAVSLAILSVRQDVRITCVERSLAAFELTRDNAALLGLEDRLQLVQGKVEPGVEFSDLDDKYHMVFSNPPYILRKDLVSLAPEIFLYEDLRALDGGAEGLDVILPILELSGAKLDSGGLVMLEVDPCHPHLLPSKLDSLHSKFVVDRVKRDFRDKERFMVLRKI